MLSMYSSESRQCRKCPTGFGVALVATPLLRGIAHHVAGSVVNNGLAPQGTALQQDSPKFANSKTGSLSVIWSLYDLPDAEITVHSPVSLSPWVRFWRCIPPANRQDAPTHIVVYQGTNPDNLHDEISPSGGRKTTVVQ